MIRKFRDSYFQGDVDKSLPDVSPIQGDLTGMPPALFTVGTRDLLLDDSLFMYGRWLSYGSNAEIIITSALALATPAAIVPTPTSETSFTLILAFLFAFFKS